jgi:hypothetical protein
VNYGFAVVQKQKKGPSSPFSRRGFSLGMPQNEKLVVPEAHNQDPVKQDPRAGEFTPAGTAPAMRPEPLPTGHNTLSAGRKL